MSDAFESSLLVTVAFYVTSALTIAGALLVVTQRDLVRSVVALAFTFVGVAAIFFILNAEFIGVVQLLVYVGAISILIAFAVMFIRDLSSAGTLSQSMLLSAIVAALFIAGTAFIVYNTEWTGIEDIADRDAVAGLVGVYEEVDESAGRVVVVEALPSDISQSTDDQSDDQISGVLIDSASPIGALLIRNFLLPFETLGLLLIAALAGALLMIRDRREDAEA